jgi:predicted nucleic acid-binding protein
LAAVLVDTNVLVYAYDQSDPDKRQKAIDVLELVGDGDTGILSTQVLGEFFVTVTRKIPSPLSDEDASAAVVRYIESWPIMQVNVAIVREALRGVVAHPMHYYDSLIWASARLNQISEILTEDGEHGRIIEGVRYLNPFPSEFDLSLLGVH